MKRYDCYIDWEGKLRIEKGDNGTLVKYDDANRMIIVLKEISQEDYRGNKPRHIELAQRVLTALGIKWE